MSNMSPFYRAGIKKICTVLLLAFISAAAGSFIAFLVDWIFFGSKLKTWIVHALFAPVGFCGCLHFFDDKYSGLRLLGLVVGAITGILITIAISTNMSIGVLFYGIFMGSLCASMGYFLVARTNILYRFGL